jgi:hypothetical protein
LHQNFQRREHKLIVLQYMLPLLIIIYTVYSEHSEHMIVYVD